MVLSGNSDYTFKTCTSREVVIGSLGLGGNNPLRIQSMTNTDTNDIEASLAQCEALIGAGAELVRLTTQGKREVVSAGVLRNRLIEKGHRVPVVADIHFNPLVAEAAAEVVDKIRINPGNYLKKPSDESEADRLATDQLSRLVKICKKNHTAIRIGVNHGSLNERILMKYGDTPEGMAESALEFIRICARLDFHQLVISLKSSNTRVMVQSVRLLTLRLIQENLNYPLHLGVTEAGNELYGRIKSVVGIAPLLLEGMGDTIRVSLTENPVNELPVAKKIRQHFKKPLRLPYNPFQASAWDPFSYKRRKSFPVCGIGKGMPVAIVTGYPDRAAPDPAPEQVAHCTITYEEWQTKRETPLPRDTIFIIEHSNQPVQVIKQRVVEFCKINTSCPIIYKRIFDLSDPDDFQILLAGELGLLLIDGILDAVWVENSNMSEEDLYHLLLHILQASGSRISQTEYIACPSCGRTHFNIESRLQEIKRATSHLKHLKIGVMGCVVNGPGEMADADYGYVGAGRGRITIYKGRQPVYKNVPEEEAIDKMMLLIREQGDWIDP